MLPDGNATGGGVPPAAAARIVESTAAAVRNPRYVNNGDSISEEILGAAIGGLKFRSWVPSGEAFTDYLNISCDRDLEGLVREDVMPFLDLLGCSEDAKQPGLYRGAKGGTARIGRRGRVATFSLSGQVLQELRDHRLFEPYLVAVGAYPHRVTMLHATQDFVVEHPPAAYRMVKALAYSGQLRLTRKAILPNAVRHWGCLASCTVRSEDGLWVDCEETGTVRLGNRANADVWAKVYDKRQERLDNGYPDPGPLMRVEIALMSDVGCTLRDAAAPGAVFWHHAATLMGWRPGGTAVWRKGGEGFAFSGERRVITRAERVAGLLAMSPDVQRVVDLAREEVAARGLDALGQDGQAAVVAWLLPAIRKRVALMPQVGEASLPG